MHACHAGLWDARVMKRSPTTPKRWRVESPTRKVDATIPGIQWFVVAGKKEHMSINVGMQGLSPSRGCRLPRPHSSLLAPSGHWPLASTSTAPQAYFCGVSAECPPRGTRARSESKAQPKQRWRWQAAKQQLQRGGGGGCAFSAPLRTRGLSLMLHAVTLQLAAELGEAQKRGI